MVSTVTTSSFCALALYAALGHGASLPATQARRASSSGMSMKGIGTGVRTMNLAGASSASSSSNVSVNDFQDVLYKVEIEIASQTFVVQMDTGSSDLWVYAPGAALNLTNTTDITATESYGQGVAEGTIVFGEFQLGGFTVPSQAFINASSAQDFAFFQEGAVGIMGLAFDDINLSPINNAIQTAYGNESTLGLTPISQIFLNNPNASNSFDIRLDRTGDLDETSSGTLLISEHDPEFANITNQPQLPRQVDGRWVIQLDGMSVNGEAATFNSSLISNIPSGKLGMLMDTGFSFPPLPPALIDMIYSSISGAIKLSDTFPQWIVPCDGATNLTFTLGGNDFPVHPLDLTFVSTTEVDINGDGNIQNVTFCYNTYQYFSLDPTGFDFDGALGDAFLKNVYASFDYGDSTDEEPFIQLLSTTNLNEAWPDFNISRSKALASLPPLIDPATLVYLSNTQSSDNDTDTDDSATKVSGAVESSSTPTPSASSDASSQLYNLVDKYGPVILGLLAGNLLVGILLLIIGLTMCLRGHMRSGAKTRSVNPSYTPVRFKEAEAYDARETYHD